MRRAWPLTARGLGALVLAAISFVFANQWGLLELMYFSILLVALVGAGLASLYLARRTEKVTRWLSPDVSTVGQTTRVTIRVDMRTALPTAPGVWHDWLPEGLEGASGGSFPALSSGLRGADHSLELAYDLEAVRRGVHYLGPLQLVASDPFGVAHRTDLVGDRSKVVVAPAIVDLAPLASVSGDTGGTLSKTTNQLGQGTDNLTPRRYVSGDSMRRIHWRATAHRDTLMVRQEEQESTPEASVVFDRAQSRWSTAAAGSPGADPLFEVGVTACVSAVARLVREGFSVEVLDSDGRPLWDRIEAGDNDAIEAMTTHFATVTARADTDLGRLARLFTGLSTGPVVVITGRVDAAGAASLDAVPHHSALPLLLVAMPVADPLTAETLGHAEAAGWRAAPIGPGADLAAAWISVIEQRGSRVLA